MLFLRGPLGSPRRSWRSLASPSRAGSESIVFGVGSRVTMVPRWVLFSIGRPVVRGRPMIPSAALGVGRLRDEEDSCAVVAPSQLGDS